MTVSLGQGTRCGFIREALVETPTWPADAPAVVTHGLPLLSASLSDGASKQFIESRAAPYGYEAATLTSTTPDAQPVFALRYEGFEQLFCDALGHMSKRIGATVLPEVIASGVYRHLYEIDNDLSTARLWTAAADGIEAGDAIPAAQRQVRRGTLAFARTVSVWEYRSAMIDQLSLRAEPSGVTCAVNLVSHSLSRVPTVNTAATMATILPAYAPDVEFWHMECLLGPYSASTALDGDDAIGAAAWSTTVQNRLTTTFGRRTGLAREEPTRPGVPLISGSVTLGRYAVDTLLDAWPANTIWMMRTRFTGPLIDGVNPFRLTIYIPSLRITQAQAPLGTGAANLPLLWFAEAPAAQPAGFPTLSRLTPIAIEVQNSIADHPLL